MSCSVRALRPEPQFIDCVYNGDSTVSMWGPDGSYEIVPVEEAGDAARRISGGDTSMEVLCEANPDVPDIQTRMVVKSAGKSGFLITDVVMLYHIRERSESP